jgi:hypothetical protein
MSEFILRRFTDHCVKKFVKNNWDSFFGISELALSKLFILAQKRLLYFKDDQIEDLITDGYTKKTDFLKTIGIISYAIFLHIQYTAVILYLNIKCFLKNKKSLICLQNILDHSEQIFYGDLARSFKGFLDISRSTQKSNLICILAPSDYNKNLTSLPQDICYTTGNKISIASFFKSLTFFFLKAFHYVRQSGNLTDISTRDFSLFLLDFSRNIYFIAYSKNISSRTNKSAIIILRDDAYYAPLIDAYNKTKNPTVHVIHGTSNNDELSTVPSLAKNIFCGGSREAQIFKQWLAPSNIFDVAAPLQVVEKDNIIKTISSINKYDIVFLASLNLKWIHQLHCNILKEADEFFSTRKLLIRHSPSALATHKEMLEKAFSTFELSTNKKLIDDIACSGIILCASEDCLQTCLMNHKKVIYFPDLEPNIHYYADSFANRLENLVVVGTVKELINAVTQLEQMDFIIKDIDKYNKELLNIFGEMDMNKIIVNFNNAFEQIHLNIKNV